MTTAYFVFRGIDRPQSEALRKEIREEHRAYLRIDQDGCRVVAGGPLVDDSGLGMFGTLLVFEAASRSAVLAFLANDPYALAGLFAQTEVVRWQWGLGAPPTRS